MPDADPITPLASGNVAPVTPAALVAAGVVSTPATPGQAVASGSGNVSPAAPVRITQTASVITPTAPGPAVPSGSGNVSPTTPGLTLPGRANVVPAAPGYVIPQHAPLPNYAAVAIQPSQPAPAPSGVLTQAAMLAAAQPYAIFRAGIGAAALSDIDPLAAFRTPKILTEGEIYDGGTPEDMTNWSDYGNTFSWLFEGLTGGGAIVCNMVIDGYNFGGFPSSVKATNVAGNGPVYFYQKGALGISESLTLGGDIILMLGPNYTVPVFATKLLTVSGTYLKDIRQTGGSYGTEISNCDTLISADLDSASVFLTNIPNLQHLTLRGVNRMNLNNVANNGFFELPVAYVNCSFEEIIISGSPFLPMPAHSQIGPDCDIYIGSSLQRIETPPPTFGYFSLSCPGAQLNLSGVINPSNIWLNGGLENNNLATITSIPVANYPAYAGRSITFDTGGLPSSANAMVAALALIGCYVIAETSVGP